MVLTGVRTTAGVVRVGETARRPATPAAGFVADLIDAFWNGRAVIPVSGPSGSLRPTASVNGFLTGLADTL